jgi:hypothetical protein
MKETQEACIHRDFLNESKRTQPFPFQDLKQSKESREEFRTQRQNVSTKAKRWD